MFLFFIGKQLEISFQNVLFLEIQVDTKAYFFKSFNRSVLQIAGRVKEIYFFFYKYIY